MKNWDKLIKKISDSAGAGEAQYLWNFLKQAYKNPKLADTLDAMSPEQFSDWVKEMVPKAKEYFIDLARKNKGTEHEKKFMSAADAFPKAWPHTWTRDQFLKALNRQPTETGKFDKQGKPIMEPAHIGKLTDDDIMYLRGEGLDEDEIPMLADKFRREYQDSVVAAAEKERPKLEEKERRKVFNEAKNSNAAGIQKLLGPDLYASMMHDISTGNSNAENWIEWLGDHMYDYGVDFAREAATLAAIYSGGLATPVIAPFATAGLVAGAGVAADAASDHYSVLGNLPANVSAGLAAGTTPWLLGSLASKLSNVANPTVKKAQRQLMKMFRRGEASAAETEANNVAGVVSDASEKVRLASKKGNAISAADAEKAVDEVMKTLENAPKYDTGIKPLDRGKVTSMLKTKKGTESLGKKVAPMSEAEYVKAQNKLKANKLRNETDLQKAIWLESQLKKQDALYPNMTKEWKEAFIPSSKKDALMYNGILKAAGTANTVGGYAEPYLENRGMGLSRLLTEGVSGDWGLKRSLNDRVKHYGVEDWEQGLNTKDPLYQEWLAKYHPELLEEQ